MTAAAGIGITACHAATPPEPDKPPPRCPVDAPVTGFADVTDPAYAGGADPTGHNDASDAFRAAVASNKPVYVPPGRYIYRGPGIDHQKPVLIGAGSGGGTTINLEGDSIFIDSDQLWVGLTLKDIRFNGGAGHVRNRFRGSNTTEYQVVSDCVFLNYTGASISNNSIDNPYWKIERNIFRANNYASSMGIALAGLTDGTSITDNSFQANRVHIKLGQGGNNAYIVNCDFLRYGAPQGQPRIDVWFTPAADVVNCGSGLVITRCKFGNENLAATDLRIVYADESDGATNDQRWPQLGTQSLGWIGGHTVSSVFTNGIGDSVTIPLVRSTTSNIVGSTYGPVTLAGSGGAPILSTMRPLLNGGRSNYVGPLLRANAYTSPLPDLIVSDAPR
jgi:hypothetical protein